MISPNATRDREPERDGDDRGQRDLRPDELAEPDEPARQPTDDVLVALGGERPGREQQREEGDREPERVGLHLGRERPTCARAAGSRTSSIGCAVELSASFVFASASRASWRKSSSCAVRGDCGIDRSTRCARSIPSTVIGAPRKLPSPPCRISFM